MEGAARSTHRVLAVRKQSANGAAGAGDSGEGVAAGTGGCLAPKWASLLDVMARSRDLTQSIAVRLLLL